MRDLEKQSDRVRERLRQIFDGHGDPIGHWVTFVLHALITLSAIAFAVSTEPDLPENIRSGLVWFERVAVAIFMVEYLMRSFAAKHPLHYLLSFWGIIDLLAWAPAIFLPVGGTAAIRLLRLMQVIRVLKIVRYSRALRRLARAFTSVRDELTLFYVIAFFLIYISAVGIYFFEHDVQPEVFRSIMASLWWAIITLTTVGYGEVIPVSIGGKVFTSFILFMGMGVFAVPAGVIASALLGGEIEELEESLEKIESSEEKARKKKMPISKN